MAKFYTDVFLLGAATMGTMMLVTRMADAVLRPDDRYHRGSHRDALGPLQALPGLDGAADGDHRGPRVFGAELRRHGPHGVRLRHADADDVRVLGDQHPVFSAARRADAGLEGAHQRHVLPLRDGADSRVHHRQRDHAAGALLRRQRHVAVRLADDDGRLCGDRRGAVLRDLRADARAGATAAEAGNLARDRPQGPGAQPTVGRALRRRHRGADLRQHPQHRHDLLLRLRGAGRRQLLRSRDDHRGDRLHPRRHGDIAAREALRQAQFLPGARCR